MKPLEPEISIRVLDEEDVESLREALNPVLAAMPYSAPLDEEEALEQVLNQDPPTVYPVRWQRNRCLGAWRGGRPSGVAFPSWPERSAPTGSTFSTRPRPLA